MRRLVAVAICGLALPAGAQAAGGPVPPQQYGKGATAPGLAYGYHALGAGPKTLLAKVWRTGPEVQRTALLRGRWGVPGVTYDGATTGLSGDGKTLVLAELNARYSGTRTRLVRVATRRMRIRDHITLPGRWVVDAISRDGRWLYLVHYRSANDLVNYDVRTYDLVKRRLLREPVVDPREPDEKMGGIPMTRAVSGDGRWAYTLYDGGGHEPFIHALDTARRTAACIDLPMLEGRDDLGLMRMALRGGTLSVGRVGAPAALVDTRTFAVREVAAPRGWLSGLLEVLARAPAGGGR
jgi:hypothetical protein